MEKQKYIALLRGINVGGHHKVPMADLRRTLAELGFDGIRTLLNSGNVIFEAKTTPVPELERGVAAGIEKVFGFAVPVIVREGSAIEEIIASDPFNGVESDKNTRLYLSFLKKSPGGETPSLPWKSDDGSFRILALKKDVVCSVLDVSKCKTPDAMGVVEKFYGKDITTRNWNTVLKIGDKLKE